MKLFAPEAYWVADFKGNGCGTRLTAFFIPDHLLWVDITEACRIHDFCYRAGKTIEDKESADRIFLNNMIRIVMAKSHFKPARFLRLMLAKLYYDVVVVFGGPAFWYGKNYVYEMGDV